MLLIIDKQGEFARKIAPFAEELKVIFARTPKQLYPEQTYLQKGTIIIVPNKTIKKEVLERGLHNQIVVINYQECTLEDLLSLTKGKPRYGTYIDAPFESLVDTNSHTSELNKGAGTPKAPDIKNSFIQTGDVVFEDKQIIRRRTTIPFEVIKKPDARISVGSNKVTRKGEPGFIEEDFDKTTGKRIMISNIKSPIAEQVRIGTKGKQIEQVQTETNTSTKQSVSKSEPIEQSPAPLLNKAEKSTKPVSNTDKSEPVQPKAKKEQVGKDKPKDSRQERKQDQNKQNNRNRDYKQGRNKQGRSKDNDSFNKQNPNKKQDKRKERSDNVKPVIAVIPKATSNKEQEPIKPKIDTKPVFITDKETPTFKQELGEKSVKDDVVAPKFVREEKPNFVTQQPAPPNFLNQEEVKPNFVAAETEPAPTFITEKEESPAPVFIKEQVETPDFMSEGGFEPVVTKPITIDVPKKDQPAPESNTDTVDYTQVGSILNFE